MVDDSSYVIVVTVMLSVGLLVGRPLPELVEVANYDSVLWSVLHGDY